MIMRDQCLLQKLILLCLFFTSSPVFACIMFSLMTQYQHEVRRSIRTSTPNTIDNRCHLLDRIKQPGKLPDFCTSSYMNKKCSRCFKRLKFVSLSLSFSFLKEHIGFVSFPQKCQACSCLQDFYLPLSPDLNLPAPFSSFRSQFKCLFR